MYIVPDLLEEIFLRLPPKPILRFKAVSKQWRSILESRRFSEMRMKFQKNHRKILIAGDNHQTDSRFEEIEIVSLHSDDATKTSMTCDGLVCIPVPGSVNVINPSTGESLTFPSGPDPEYRGNLVVLFPRFWWNTFPGYYAMGFGKDKVNGSYKIVRMFFYPSFYCEILDVEIGEWRRLSNRPPYKVEHRRKSACANGSIYWLELYFSFSVLALDLHTEEFRVLPAPPVCVRSDQVINFEDRLAIASTRNRYGWKLHISCIDAQEETWSMTHSISLGDVASPPSQKLWFKPVAVSKRGNIFYYDNVKRLFKYDPKTQIICCLSTDMNVISSFVENLVSFRRPSSVVKTSEVHHLEHAPSSRIPKIFRRMELRIPNILLTTSLVSLVIFRCFVVLSKSNG